MRTVPPQSEEFDGLKFTTVAMDPLELYPMVPRVLKIVAAVLPHVSAIGGGLSKEAVEKLFKSDMGKLAPVLAALGEALASKENATLPTDLLKRTTVALPVESDDDDEDEETTPKVRQQSMVSAKEINAVFRGRFFTMLKVMWWVLGANFADFFSSGSGSNPSKE
jgi:hypothetical protein